MSNTVTISRKIGRNRGKPRLWIEGQALVEAGLPHGTPWSLMETAGGNLMIAAGTFEGVRSRKVAGKTDRPVIDIVGASLGKLGACDKVLLTYVAGEGRIVIMPTIEDEMPLAA